jgi:phosphate starvation-inducible membrane PsiE
MPTNLTTMMFKICLALSCKVLVKHSSLLLLNRQTTVGLMTSEILFTRFVYFDTVSFVVPIFLRDSYMNLIYLNFTNIMGLRDI